MNNAGMWGSYVNALMIEREMTETEFASEVKVQQGTLNRWRHGKAVPDKAAHVARFARELERNPLEAFVAAGMLDEGEAGRGLTEDDRAFLAHARTVSIDELQRSAKLTVKDVDAEPAIGQPKPAKEHGRGPQ